LEFAGAVKNEHHMWENINKYTKVLKEEVTQRCSADLLPDICNFFICYVSSALKFLIVVNLRAAVTEGQKGVVL
jgi:hypothetical protein